MGDDAIYMLASDGKLERVPLQTWDSEMVLQKLIEDYPALLAGEQIDPDDPPRWLLVKKEAGIPDGTTSSDRWSADHLLLDQNARPTIVEVKRSSDTRIRREVVGQMLDYAANATVYWPADRIRSLATVTCGSPESLDEKICDLIGADNSEESLVEVENYWRKVEANLRSGELRLLFVADELPRELRRIIEFLNEHMPRIEVLGVEVREFAGANMRALVPRVIGQTERARQDKAPQPTRKTNTAEVIEKSPDWCRAFLQEWFDNATKEGFRVIPGTKGVSIRVPQKDGKFVTLVQVYPPGAFGYAEPHLYVCFPYLAPFETSKVVSQALLKAAPFKVEKDQVKLFLDPTNLRAAGAALRYLWEIGRKILTTPAMAQKTTPKTSIG